ncbi:N-acetylglucosamine-6-phosphate deacetylase [Paenibacillus yanchengensis]|uniref:N-acetylglucosamine-6-phosphate deacetylase n=1 Tax=Paenibacillus yanchengensis TaxID=2035833 RepID=A0ABW4YLH5_9BACL
MMSAATSWIINNVRIVTETSTIYGAVVVELGKIANIIPASSKEYHLLTENIQQIATIDGQNGLLMAGFIDVHVHGGNGGDFMNADHASYDAITSFHAAHGTTKMLATTMTASKEAIEAVLAAVTSYRQNQQTNEQSGATIIGVHLEGPFISEKWPGAQNPAYIQPPTKAWLAEWIDKWPDQIKLLTLAPEKEEAAPLINWLANQQIITACGHTDALYSDIQSAADAGLTHAVHTFNAMKGLHHREPGTLGAVLTDDRIYCEIIADGEHVHRAAIDLLLRAKPIDKLILITDAIEAAGMVDGNYQLGGLAVTVKDGVARLTEGGALAGSSLTMNKAVQYLANNSSLALHEISQLASKNAARQLGIDHTTGSISIGKQADLVWLDDNFQVQSTWTNGIAIYNR